MRRVWYRQDREAVLAALRRGERPDLATTTACGPLDELVALHDELGIFRLLDRLPVARDRAGLPDALLLRSLATLPFVAQPALAPAAGALFREPAVLLQLGWAPAQIRNGDNGRHRHPDGRQAESLPCHPDTLRDQLRRIAARAWDRAQRAGVQALYQRRLVAGKVYAVDGSGLGPGLRLVCLVSVGGPRPLLVAWRLLEGDASEKGKEAAVTKDLVEHVLAAGGDGCIELLLADALYADGPLLAWLKHAKRIDALVALPSDRLLYQDLQGLARGGLVRWTRHRYVRTVAGHKQLRVVEVASSGGLTSWEGFTEAAAKHGAAGASLWGCLIRQREPEAWPVEEAEALVSTRAWPDGFQALLAYRPRWHIEDDAYRELKEGWGLEEQRWGRDPAAARGRVALTCLAFNTAQAYRLAAGQRLAKKGIRRLRREYQRELGAAPVVVYVAGCYAALAVEELLAALGRPVQETLLPFGGQKEAADAQDQPPDTEKPP
jgi:Transposase DDE domain